MVKKIIVFLSCLCFFDSVIAGPCDEYKKSPEIKLEKAEYDINIKPSDRDLWPLGGYVTIRPFSYIGPNIGYVFNGKYYCVFLNYVEAKVGFRDFEITIDKKYEEGSCEYDAVLDHENQHIADSVDALDNVFSRVKDALYEAADAVEPIYLEEADDVPYAVEKIQKQVTEYKKLKDLVDEFKEQQNKDAAHLDGTPDEHLQKCQQDKMKSAFEKYYKKKGIKK